MVEIVSHNLQPLSLDLHCHFDTLAMCIKARFCDLALWLVIRRQLNGDALLLKFRCTLSQYMKYIRNQITVRLLYLKIMS